MLPWPQYWAWRLCGETASEVSSLGCHTDLWRPYAGAFSDLGAAPRWAERFGPDALGRRGAWGPPAGIGCPDRLAGELRRAVRRARQQRLALGGARDAVAERCGLQLWFRPAPGLSPFRSAVREGLSWTPPATPWSMSASTARPSPPRVSWAGGNTPLSLAAISRRPGTLADAETPGPARRDDIAFIRSGLWPVSRLAWRGHRRTGDGGRASGAGLVAPGLDDERQPGPDRRLGAGGRRRSLRRGRGLRRGAGRATAGLAGPAVAGRRRRCSMAPRASGTRTWPLARRQPRLALSLST